MERRHVQFGSLRVEQPALGQMPHLPNHGGAQGIEPLSGLVSRLVGHPQFPRNPARPLHWVLILPVAPNSKTPASPEASQFLCQILAAD